MNKTFLYEQLLDIKKELKELKDMLKLNPQFKKTTIDAYQNEINTLKKQTKTLEIEIKSI